MGDLRQWKHAPLCANGASRSLTRVNQRSAAAIPSYFANVMGLGYWPSRYSTVGLIELGRHAVLLAAAGLTIDASCAVGHASIAAYVSQINYPYGPCIPGDVGAFTLLMDLCISLIVLGSRNFAVGEEGIPISKFCCR